MPKKIFHTLASPADCVNLLMHAAGGMDKLESEWIPFWWGLSNLAPIQ